LNTYSEAAGADVCTPCPAGSYAGLGESKCHTCCSGQYFDPERKECIDCMASYYTPNAGEVCKKCPCKMWSHAKEKECHKCECGTVINADQTGCDVVAVPTNQPTPTVVLCDLGQKKVDGQCVDCLAGFYGDRNNCYPCPFHEYQPKPRSGQCLTCGDFAIINEGRTTCTYICALGQGKVDGKCVDCLPGTYGDSVTCNPCPNETYSDANRSVRCRSCAEFGVVNKDKTGCDIKGGP
jgi:hypothetical protein